MSGVERSDGRREKAGAKTIKVIVETPRGCRNKYKYDPKSGRFLLRSVLPAGTEFPYDFGFVPRTKAPDGDPIDVLILMDEPAFPGCQLEVRLIGVFEAEQTEEGETTRNDRLIGVAVEAHNYKGLKKLSDVEKNLLAELEQFFTTYGKLRGKEVRIIARRGPKAARRLVRDASRGKVR